MAGVASARRARVGRLMTGDTVYTDMLPGQREGGRVMIENCRLPGRVVMTRGAVGAELRGDMAWIGGGIIVGLMTPKTVGRYSGIAAFVALDTLQALVRAGQGKELVVVGRLLPIAKGGVVTSFAITFKARLGVIRTGNE